MDFVRDVRPILEKHCYECHGETKQKSGLRLDVKSAAFKGGDEYGAPFAPGKAEDSVLIKLVTSRNEDEAMPKRGERLTESEIDTLTAWIDAGAVWPEGVDRVKLADPLDHWSFKPLRTDFGGARSIDDFIDAKLAGKGLARSREADRVTWLRRVTFDLTGFPPTPEEVAAFQADQAD
ncbi:MAG: DUF1549 domain-containing protein, partial [Verrucomicrobiae bacterium]|nr:DUF1549 domain-containing protein [Verrucomicrobiae bacterium]